MSDTGSSRCPVCSDLAEGYHYGIECCRSCAMFFKRCVEKNKKFDYHPHPAPGETAEVVCDVKTNKNLCKQCRLQLCIDVGMQPSLVQQKRCATGPQPNRKRKNAVPEDDDEEAEEMEEALQEMQERQDVSHWMWFCPMCEGGRCKEGIDTFKNLIEVYGNHFRTMQLQFATVPIFLQEMRQSVKLREFGPDDVQKLSDVERAGLLYWVERMGHFHGLPEGDKENLLNRYSVRKLSLDHFYSASKYPEEAKERKFVMNNYTYVPPDKTGFELPHEDSKQHEAKRSIMAGTFKRFWENVIDRFIALKFGDAEMVFLHLMLMWSPLNQLFVTNLTQAVLRSRRTWTFKMMFEYYESIDFPDPELRIAELVRLFEEVEVIVNMHCTDIHVAKLFDFFGMEDFWYDTACYSGVNIDRPLSPMDKEGLENQVSSLAAAMRKANVNNRSAVVPRIEELVKGFIAHDLDLAEMKDIPWYLEEKRRLSAAEEDAPKVPATMDSQGSTPSPYSPVFTIL